MNRWIIIFILLPFCVLGQQNLVSDGGFEVYSECPTTIDSWTLQYWTDANGSTPDQYDSCITTFSHGVPQNNHGYQEPMNGQGYVGVWTYSSLHPEGREYIQTHLNSPLVSGIRYQVSFYVSLAEDYSGYATSTIGAAFTTQPPTIISDNGLLDAEPQILNDSPYSLSDTANWVLISDTVLSRGDNEQYLTIGNFSNDTESGITVFNPDADVPFVSYYYIDDVSVVAIDSVPNGIEEQEALGFEVYPNPAIETLNIKSERKLVGVHLFDMAGRCVFAESIAAYNHAMNLGGIQEGMYLLEAVDEEGRKAVRKILKE